MATTPEPSDILSLINLAKSYYSDSYTELMTEDQSSTSNCGCGTVSDYSKFNVLKTEIRLLETEYLRDDTSEYCTDLYYEVRACLECNNIISSINTNPTPPVVNPPNVNAGNNQNTNTSATVTLSGTATANGSRTIISTIWTQISGPSIDIHNPTGLTTATFNPTSVGTYIFQLTAIDSAGSIASATTQVVSIAFALPIVNAGSPQTVNLPTTTIVLNGIVTQGTYSISSTTWTKVSGPTCTISNPSSTSTSVTITSDGTYIFRLTAIDSAGNNVSNTTNVIIVYILPQVTVGSTQNIQLPTNSGTLTGSYTVGSYSVVSATWAYFSGPSTYTVSSGGSYSGLIQGNYSFSYTVTDSNGRTAVGYTAVQVAAAAIIPVPVVWGYNASDFSGNLTGFTFQFSGTVNPGSNLSLDFTHTADQNFLMVKELASEPIKVSWINTVLNAGTIPDFVYYASTIVGSYRYYYTRNIASVDSLNSIIQYNQ